MEIYRLATGPLVWIALTVFVTGSIGRISLFLIQGKKEKILYPKTSIVGGIRSLLHGLLPYSSGYMRKRPIFTSVTFVFHLCVMVLPVFLLAHAILWSESWNIDWWSLPDPISDVMTVMVIVSCIFFFIRRLVVPEVRQMSRKSDFLLPIIIMLPFLSGFLAYHQWGPYRFVLLVHIFSSEILLTTIPFTRLSHMLFFPFSRIYMGSTFGRVLKAREW